jgi:hypothetical protein
VLNKCILMTSKCVCSLCANSQVFFMTAYYYQLVTVFLLLVLHCNMNLVCVCVFAGTN